MEHKLKIGITHGDINGVGYEVILKTLSDPRIVELCTPVVYGSSKVAAYHRKALDLPPFNFNIITSAEQCAAGKINMISRRSRLSRPRSRDSRLAGRAYRCYRYSTDQQTHHTVGQIRLPGTYRIL